MKTLITILALIIHTICINAQEVPFIMLNGGTLLDGNDDLTHSVGIGQPITNNLDVVLKYKHSHLYDEDIRNYDLYLGYDIVNNDDYSFGTISGLSLVDRDIYKNILQAEGLFGIYNKVRMTEVVSLYIPVEFYLNSRYNLERLYIAIGFNLNFIPNQNKIKRFF